jgi:hypothetical protein
MLQIPTHPPWGRCEASGDNCPVHSAILPRTHWAFYHSPEGNHTVHVDLWWWALPYTCSFLQ